VKNKISGNIAAAILAGGKNSRMNGKNKAFLKINGTFFIRRLVKLLKEIFEEVIIVTNSPVDFKQYQNNAVITADIIKDTGPLGGIHSALSATSKNAVFFVACDMPFLHNALILHQLKVFGQTNCKCLVPRIGPSIEPLHAIYKKELKDRISVFVKNSRDHSIRSFLKTTDVYYWNLENNRLNRRVFKNLNTIEDLKNTGVQL
jgi:molybdopterin-guanine dinucleotide biosynthesis protein A